MFKAWLLCSLFIVSICFAQQDPTVQTLCVCKCCYLGACNPMEGASWLMSSCSNCTSDQCNNYIQSAELRGKTTRTFELLQEGIPSVAKTGVTIDVCQVISVLEIATCPKTGSCKRVTDVKADCFDRNAPINKYSIFLFLLVTIVCVIFGFIRNHIPALQDLNAKYFNY